MRLHNLDNTSIKYYLSEELRKDSALNEQWDRIDTEFFKPWQQYLNEAAITPDQVNQIFAAAEKETSAGGGNSSMLGKIVDKVIPSAFLSKLEKSLPEPDPNAQPDPEFEAKATAAVNNLEAPAETKTGLMAIIKAAVKNPQVQAMVLSLVGGVLGGLVQAASPLIQSIFPGGGTAVVAITGAIVAGGVAIAAAKLQGKGWKEAFKGAIKPALAGAAGAVIGSMAAQFAGGAVSMAANAVKGAGAPGAPPESDYVKDMRAQGKDPNDPDGTLRLGLKGNSSALDLPGGGQITDPNGPDYNSDYAEIVRDSPELVQNKQHITDLDSKFSGPSSTGKIDAFMADKPPATATGKGEIPAGATATDNAGSYFLNKTNPDGSTSQTVRQNADPADPRVRANIQAKQDYYKNDPAGQAELKRIMAPSRFDSYTPTGKKLSEGQVYLVFNRIVTRNDRLLSEGWLAEGVFDKIKQFGKNLTTKVTADKLNSAWVKAGSKLDSDAVATVLKSAGVNDTVVSKVYGDLKLPAPAAGAAATGADQPFDMADLEKQIGTFDLKQKQDILAYLTKSLRTA